MTIREDIQFVFSEQGVRSVSSALGGMTSVISRVTSMLNPLNVAIGALGAGGALAGISDLGSGYEDLRIQMAQTLRMMGRGGDSFSDALTNADSTIQQIYTAAAALPGEAEDYALAMRMAGANVNRATGDYQQTFDLVRDMTAIGVSMGRNSAETAMVLSNALNTQRGMLEQGSDYTRDLVNSMRSIPEYANITTQSFNDMRLEDRVRVMQQLAGVYSDMIDASSNTWAAVSGAFMTMARQIARLSTADVFATMTRSLQTVNATFVDSNGNLTEFGVLVTRIGSLIGDKIGSALEWLAESLQSIGENSRSWLQSLAESPAIAMLDRIIGGIGGAVDALSQAGGGGEGRGVAGAAAGAAGAGLAVAGLVEAEIALTGPLAAVLVPLTVGFANFLTRTEAVNQTMEALRGIFDSLTQIIGPAIGYISSLSDLLGGIVAGVLPPLMEALQMLLDPIFMVAGGLMTLMSYVYSTVAPGFETLARGVGVVVRGLASILAPVIRLVGSVLLYLYDIIARFVAPILNVLAEAIGSLLEAIGGFLSWLGNLIGMAVDSVVSSSAEAERPETTAMRDMLNSLTTSLEGTANAADAAAGSTSEATAAATAARPTPGGRGGGGVHQDFRNSRFEIQQKFEEGFDPDRIAVAFANDLGRVGERRLTSGFEPMFGVR